MDAAEDDLTDRDAKTRSKLNAIRAAREAVFHRYMNVSVEEQRPTPGQFADPRAAISTGFTGR